MLKLTAAGDLSRTTGRFDTLDEADDVDACVAQRIAIRLRRRLGEYPWDTRLGLDWDLLTAKGTPNGVRVALVRDQVAGTAGVEEVVSVTVDIDNATRAGTIAVIARRTGGALVDLTVPVEV